MHIPRTAGTTVTAALDDHFRAGDIFPGQLLGQLADAPTDGLRRFRLFRGHFGTVLPHLLEWRVRCFTVLRDPVESVLSLFAFICRNERHPFHERLRSQQYRLATFLRDPTYRGVVGNWQARWLAADPAPGDWAWARPGPDGLPSSPEGFEIRPLATSQEELLSCAQTTLQRAEVVGVTEQLDFTMYLVADAMGWPPPETLARRNVAPRRLERAELSPEDGSLIRELNQADLALHGMAQRRLAAAREREADRPAGPRDAHPIPALPPGRSYEYDMSMPLAGVGWHPRYHSSQAGWLRWTGPGNESAIDLPVAMAVPGVVRVEAWVVAAVSPVVLDSLRVTVAGEPIALRSTVDGTAVVLRGDVAVPVGGPLRLAFTVSATGTLGDDRPVLEDHLPVGVALSRLRVSPLPDGP